MISFSSINCHCYSRRNTIDILSNVSFRRLVMCKVSRAIRKLALCKEEKQVCSVSVQANQLLYFSLPTMHVV